MLPIFDTEVRGIRFKEQKVPGQKKITGVKNSKTVNSGSVNFW